MNSFQNDWRVRLRLRYRANILSIILLLLTASLGWADTSGTIDVPGAIITYPRDINNAGEIVGYYTDSHGMNHGFLFSRGSFTKIDFPGALWTEAWGTNDIGEVVGAYEERENGVQHGFLLSKGKFSTVDYPGARITKAIGINNLGEVVGIYDGVYSFLLSRGRFSRITFPDAATTIARGINDSGEIVGLLQVNDTATLFRWSQGRFHLLSLPPYVQHSSGYGINNIGEITGVYIDASGRGLGFLLSGEIFVSIDLPAINGGVKVFGINDRGMMVGVGCEEGSCHGFILTDPDPPSRSPYSQRVLGTGRSM